MGGPSGLTVPASTAMAKNPTIKNQFLKTIIAFSFKFSSQILEQRRCVYRLGVRTEQGNENELEGSGNPADRDL
jgi:hypothetical protein